MLSYIKKEIKELKRKVNGIIEDDNGSTDFWRLLIENKKKNDVTELEKSVKDINFKLEKIRINPETFNFYDKFDLSKNYIVKVRIIDIKNMNFL